MCQQATLEMKEAAHRSGSIQLIAELPDKVPQIVRVFLYDPQKLLRVRKLGLWHFLTRVWAVICIHGQWFKGEPKGTIELNQKEAANFRRPLLSFVLDDYRQALKLVSQSCPAT
jgi:hypothetical protein